MFTSVISRNPSTFHQSVSWKTKTNTHCSNCAIHHLCMPQGLSAEALISLEYAIQGTRPVKRNEALFREGDAFENLYIIRSGSFKTLSTRHDGREQITGLYLTGEALGLDGIHNEILSRTAIAIEDSSVCVLPYQTLKALCAEAVTIQNRMMRFLSEQLVRETSQTMLLGSLNAEERVAAFLLDISLRYLKRGYSSTEFNLKMTREDIGSYLGMTLETVSRTLSKFQKRSLIQIQGRMVRILDFDGLRHL